MRLRSRMNWNFKNLCYSKVVLSFWSTWYMHVHGLPLRWDNSSMDHLYSRDLHVLAQSGDIKGIFWFKKCIFKVVLFWWIHCQTPVEINQTTWPLCIRQLWIMNVKFQSWFTEKNEHILTHLRYVAITPAQPATEAWPQWNQNATWNQISIVNQH